MNLNYRNGHFLGNNVLLILEIDHYLVIINAQLPGLKTRMDVEYKQDQK